MNEAKKRNNEYSRFILDTSHSSFSSLTFAIFEYCGFSFNTKGKCLDSVSIEEKTETVANF